ncbi:MAG TPA: hypothetical protein VML96_11635, partial [Egibacteraceae bacterium]|nr:hypothetical protein [Egibacteraceae bacterium]
MRSDVSSQMRYATWAKGHVPTQIGLIRDPTNWVPILISIVLIGAVGGIGFIIGTGLIGSQPIASPVAAVPTATAVPDPSAPGDPTGQPTAEPPSDPVDPTGQPTAPPPTAPPPTDPPTVTGLETIGRTIPITDISRYEDGPPLLA